MDVNISVIIPIFNAEKHIEECLDSVLAQTLTSYELILVNDGSRDNTLTLLEKYKNNTCVKIINKTNGGASSARNLGIENAKGKYLAFLDSDDLWHPEKLAIQFDVMEKNKNLLACYSKVVHSESSKNLSWPEISVIQTKLQEINEIFLNPYLVTSSFFVKKDVVISVNKFDQSLKTAEDIDLYLKIANRGTIGKINQFLAFKAKTENSLGSSINSYQDNLYVVERFVDTLNDLSRYPKLYPIVKEKILYDWIKDLSWQGYPFKTFKTSISLIKYTKKLKLFPILLKLILMSFLRRRKRQK